ncbi:MAG: heme-binding protein [Cyanobacteria bacterium]|nr:heme-binding protein [Cyanobacteriota bacterium]
MRLSSWALGGILVTAGALVVAVREARASYEEPEYRVLQKQGSSEVREYPPMLAAEVTVTGDGDSQANEAFKILAGYIFGRNKSRAKIAMTVPVTQQVKSEKISMTIPVTRKDAGGNLTMRFYMPSNYTLETLPIADDKKIRIVQVPKQKFAVLRFSGSASDGNFRKHAALLKAFVDDVGLKSCGDSCRAYYNPPWTIPLFKRNEIWIPVD